jgi:REP element-mobilizing transposase RayT
MSRLRRLVLCDRFSFVARRLLPQRVKLEEPELERWARVVRERREAHHFLLTAWVFLPEHWHAVIFPRYPLTISRVMEAIKVGSTHGINSGRRESGLLWQPRLFDRALRNVGTKRHRLIRSALHTLS